MNLYRRTPAVKATGPVPQVEFLAPAYVEPAWRPDSFWENFEDLLTEPTEEPAEVIEITREASDNTIRRRDRRRRAAVRVANGGGAPEADIAELNSFLADLG